MNDELVLNKQVVKEVYDSYHDYFIEVIHNIIMKLNSNLKLMTQPTFKSRVKSFNSYYKKVIRLKKNQIKDSNSIIYITDMMGIRIICAFLEDINNAVEQIKEVFCVKEVEIKGADHKFSEFGYESVHVLISIPDDCKPKLEGDFKNLSPIPDEMVCEIQIRTILQDAWAEVEHELIYKSEFTPFDKPLRRKLASINASLTLADITFQEIRDYQKKFQKEIDQRRNSFYSIADDFLDEKHENQNEDELKRVSPFVQGSIDDLLLRGIEAHNQGRLDEAILIYSKIIEVVSKEDHIVSAVIHKHRGMAYFSKSDFENAEKDFKESIRIDPTAYRTFYYLGIVYAIQKKYSLAVENYTASLDINRFQAHTNYRRALAYYEMQEYEKAMHDIDIALKLGLDPKECKALSDKISKKLGLSM